MRVASTSEQRLGSFLGMLSTASHRHSLHVPPASGLPGRTPPTDTELQIGSPSDTAQDSHPIVAGDLVEVLSMAEIEATLDRDGKLDGVPFMPEMLAYCGQRFHVLRRADRICARGALCKLEGTVQLAELRCDGSAHQNCQARCLLLWKEGWLRYVNSNGAAGIGKTAANPIDNKSSHSSLGSHITNRNGVAACQLTEVFSGTCPLERETRSHYAWRLLYGALSRTMTKAQFREAWALFKGAMILRGFKLWTRLPWNSRRYRTTPTESLNLQAGETVQVRSVREILATLDQRGRNRGLAFEPEMFRFCGRKYTVASRLERRIHEESGVMQDFSNHCILLDSVLCQGQRSRCVRGDYYYWREIWLRRI